MNEIQSKLLEIAKEYIKVCEKLNLRYFAIGGTALGAVRHHGFIPWDDDMDFAMPRKDYEIFIKEGKKYLPSKYFIQEHRTEKKYFLPFAKIRDSETTAIEEMMKSIDMNHGLWVDIFPIDGLPESLKLRQKMHKKDQDFYRRRYLANVWNYGNKKKNFLNKLLLPSKELAYSLSRRMSTKYKIDDCDYVWYNWIRRTKTFFRKEHFNSSVKMSFETIEINVPFAVEKYLEVEYGNWKEFPPLEKRNSGHVLAVVDLKKSYINYIKK